MRNLEEKRERHFEWIRVRQKQPVASSVSFKQRALVLEIEHTVPNCASMTADFG